METFLKKSRFFSQPVRVLIKREINFLVSEIKFSRVLDVGGGTGRHRSVFKGADEYIILDSDARVSPDVVGSAEQLPFNDSSFDCILCSEVLEHIKDPIAAIREIERVLNAGGNLILTVPFMNELHGEPFDFRRFTIFGLKELFNEFPSLVIERILVRGNWNVTMWQFTTRALIELANRKPILGLPISQICKLGTKLILLNYPNLSEDIAQRFALGYSLRVKKL